MAVYLSTHMRDAFVAAQLNQAQFVKQFQWWKAAPENAGRSMFFGRDTRYAEPQIEGRGMVLWHVHLLPLKDAVAHERWLKVHRRGGEKKSDKALVYAQNELGDYLLIYIFDEPTAHAQARRDKPLMRAFAKLAIQFIDGDLEDFQVAAPSPETRQMKVSETAPT